MSPKSHSTEGLTELTASLYASLWAVKTAFLNGLWRFTHKGYAGSPYIHRGRPAGERAYGLRSANRLESANIPASCFLPSEKYNARTAQQVFWVGGLFLAPLFLLNYFLFNLFFILAKKRGPCHRTKYQESVIGNVEEICETGYIFFTASINLFYTSSFPRSKLSFCNERSCQSVDISTQIL